MFCIKLLKFTKKYIRLVNNRTIVATAPQRTNLQQVLSIQILLLAVHSMNENRKLYRIIRYLLRFEQVQSFSSYFLLHHNSNEIVHNSNEIVWYIQTYVKIHTYPMEHYIFSYRRTFQSCFGKGKIYVNLKIDIE